jgi:hypothetical protein
LRFAAQSRAASLACVVRIASKRTVSILSTHSRRRRGYIVVARVAVDAQSIDSWLGEQSDAHHLFETTTIIGVVSRPLNRTCASTSRGIE